MRIIEQKKMERQVKRLKNFVDKKGYLQVAAACGYDDTSPIRRWIDRGRIPRLKMEEVEKTITGEYDVRIQIVERKKV